MEKAEKNSGVGTGCAAVDARLLALRIRMEAVRCEVLGMYLHDEYAIRTGSGPYEEGAYTEMVKALEALADEAEEISGAKEHRRDGAARLDAGLLP